LTLASLFGNLWLHRSNVAAANDAAHEDWYEVVDLETNKVVAKNESEEQ
jgi:hypothetical protein